MKTMTVAKAVERFGPLKKMHGGVTVWLEVETSEGTWKLRTDHMCTQMWYELEPSAPKRYQCEACNHICTEKEMGADSVAGGDGADEWWSNWICPSCDTWHPGLHPEGGWVEVEESSDA